MIGFSSGFQKMLWMLVFNFSWIVDQGFFSDSDFLVLTGCWIVFWFFSDSDFFGFASIMDNVFRFNLDVGSVGLF